MKHEDFDHHAGWRPMRTAPRDGTLILVCEMPCPDKANVLPAMFMNYMGEDEGFWAVGPSSFLPAHVDSIERREMVAQKGLPASFKALAITPLCWQPFPTAEPLDRLRHRQSQLLAAKFKA